MRRKPHEIDFDEEAAPGTAKVGIARRQEVPHFHCLLPGSKAAPGGHRRRLCAATIPQWRSDGTSATAGLVMTVGIGSVSECHERIVYQSIQPFIPSGQDYALARAFLPSSVSTNCGRTTAWPDFSVATASSCFNDTTTTNSRRTS